MHDYYIVKNVEGIRWFYNYPDNAWDRHANGYLFTLSECARIVPRIQADSMFEVTVLHFREVK